MKKMTLKSDYVSKVYSRKVIFQNISFSVSQNSSFAITGKNGSGKSTLIKILCGVLAPSKGTISLNLDNIMLKPDEYFPYIGLVSPYLNMYEEFTGEENLHLIRKIRGLNSDSTVRIEALLKEFNIYEHRKKEVRFYSSGMKQRLKYCAALLHSPIVLFLDEPSANLDEMGIRIVHDAMKRQTKDGALVFATNERDDLKFADSVLNLDEFDKG